MEDGGMGEASALLIDSWFFIMLENGEVGIGYRFRSALYSYRLLGWSRVSFHILKMVFLPMSSLFGLVFVA